MTKKDITTKKAARNNFLTNKAGQRPMRISSASLQKTERRGTMYRICKIEKTSFPFQGIYNYNAQVWLSLDGENFYYAGLGKYFRTEAEALAYKAEIETKEP